MSAFATPVVIKTGSDEPGAPLVVLLHGRGSMAREIIGLAPHLPSAATYVAVNAPISEMGGYAWFANKGIGRPKAESLADTTGWFETWLSEYAKGRTQVFIIGFSGGGAFAGALAWRQPARYAGVGLLYCTMPWDADCDESAGRLASLPIFIAQGDGDQVIPQDLQVRSWKYITEESKGIVTAHRGPEGHGLSQDGVAKLAEWLNGLFKSE